jgi:hypothetical protein
MNCNVDKSFNRAQKNICLINDTKLFQLLS